MILNYILKGRGIQKRGWVIGRPRCQFMCRTRCWFSFPGPLSAQTNRLHLPLDFLSLRLWAVLSMLDGSWENRSPVICFNSPGGNSEVVLLSPSVTHITTLICVPGSWEPEKGHCNPPEKLGRPRQYMWQSRLQTPEFFSLYPWVL